MGDEEPAYDQQMNDAQLAWHYTTGENFIGVAQDGVIRPSTAFLKPPEQPVVWFSTHPYFEPTACKMDENRQQLSMEETMRRGGGLVRLGVPTSWLVQWPDVAERAKIPELLRQGLEQSAEDMGADPAQWWGTARPVPVDRCHIEIMQDNEWITLSDDLEAHQVDENEEREFLERLTVRIWKARAEGAIIGGAFVLGIGFLLYLVVQSGIGNPMSAFLYAAMLVMVVLLWQRVFRKP